MELFLVMKMNSFNGALFLGSACVIRNSSCVCVHLCR
jgi:hypothetical protein